MTTQLNHTSIEELDAATDGASRVCAPCVICACRAPEELDDNASSDNDARFCSPCICGR